jgi:trigger factor
VMRSSVSISILGPVLKFVLVRPACDMFNHDGASSAGASWTVRRALLALALLGGLLDAFQPQRASVLRRGGAPRFASPAPVIEKGANSTVTIRVQISAEDTLAAFENAAKDFAKGVDIRGFRKGSKIPTQVVVASIGADAVKSKAIDDLNNMALARVNQMNEVTLIGSSVLEHGEDHWLGVFEPGKDFEFNIKCDVWPEINFVKGLEDLPKLTVEQEPVDTFKVEEALKGLQERYLTTAPTASGTEAVEGMVVVGSMHGFTVNDNASKGTPLPAVASGDDVEIVLETGKFMPGLVEGLVGIKTGEAREIRVSFPEQISRNLGEDLAGKPAIFEVVCDAVKTRELPQLDDAFAESIRPGLTYDELYKEVRNAVGEDGDKRNKNQRNVVLEKALTEMVAVEIPDTLIEQQAKEKYAEFMADQRASGIDDEQLKKMITKEGFLKFKKVSTPSISRTLKSSLVLEELARKENFVPDAADVEDQLNLARQQAAQNNEDFQEAQVKESIEATLKREKVLDYVASKVDIDYVEVDHISRI